MSFSQGHLSQTPASEGVLSETPLSEASLSDEPEGPWDASAPRNAFERSSEEYEDFRPSYPDAAVRAALGGEAGFVPARSSSASEADEAERLSVIDMGAGTGKFTNKLLELGLDVWAVEPAAAMRNLLVRSVQARHRDVKIVEDEADAEAALTVKRIQFGRGDLVIVDATAEHSGLPDRVADVVTFVQCWHWVDQEAALAEAARLLRPGGHVSIIFNQMDVSIPWVHRLTRIMRSGDVHPPQKVPQVREGWSEPTLYKTEFSTRMTPQGVMALARTRSSYLKSTPANRAKMQENLRWYLHEHLGYSDDDVVEIPYYCLVWNTFYEGVH